MPKRQTPKPFTMDGIEFDEWLDKRIEKIGTLCRQLGDIINEIEYKHRCCGFGQVVHILNRNVYTSRHAKTGALMNLIVQDFSPNMPQIGIVQVDEGGIKEMLKHQQHQQRDKHDEPNPLAV